MLAIGKQTKFDSGGHAIRGQCLAHTPGWRLRWFEKGVETLLREGTLPECRRAMTACRDAGDAEEALAAVEKWSKGKGRALGSVLAPTDVYPAVSDGHAESRGKARRHRKRGR